MFVCLFETNKKHYRWILTEAIPFASCGKTAHLVDLGIDIQWGAKLSRCEWGPGNQQKVWRPLETSSSGGAAPHLEQRRQGRKQTSRGRLRLAPPTGQPLGKRSGWAVRVGLLEGHRATQRRDNSQHGKDKERGGNWGHCKSSASILMSSEGRGIHRPPLIQAVYRVLAPSLAPCKVAGCRGVSGWLRP